MGSKYGKAKGRSGHKFVMLRHDIMDSLAYRALSAPARCVLHEIIRRYNGNNNGEIPLSCREAADLVNVSKDTAGKAFTQLIDAGFIKENSDNFQYVINRQSRRWGLTYEGMNNTLPTNEWKKFKSWSDFGDGVSSLRDTHTSVD